jgi:HK97 family phage major capsid protein
MTTLAEKIEAAETELTALKDNLTEAVTALEAAPDEESLLAQVEELTNQVEAKTATVGALHKAEKALAARARPVNENSQAPAYAPNLKTFRDPKEGGEIMWKHATAKLLAHVERKSPEQVIAERYADDERVKATWDFVEKTAVNPAMTTVPAWAGALVREDTRGFIESMAEVSVAAALASRANSFSFDGANSIKIPTENPLGQAPSEPAWVGEAGAIPLTSFGFGSITLSPYKLAAISTMSREIVSRSTPSIEALIQNGLRKAYAKVLDNALINPAITAVANVRPASLLNGVAALTAGTGGDIDNIKADILSMLSAMSAVGLGQSPVLLLNKLDVLSASMLSDPLGNFAFRDELSSGRLLGIPVIASGHVPQRRAIMVDAAYVAMALGGIEFDVSDVATVVEANADLTAPTMANYGASGAAGAEPGRVAVDGGIKVEGTTGTGSAGYTARSLWQTYSLGIRMVSQTSFGKTNAAAAQWVDSTDWTAG